MSIRINSSDIFYDELKRKLAKKNTLVLELREFLFYHRNDPKLLDFLIANLSNDDKTVKRNSMVSIYIMVSNFDNNYQLSIKEEELLIKYINKYQVDESLEEIIAIAKEN